MSDYITKRDLKARRKWDMEHMSDDEWAELKLKEGSADWMAWIIGVVFVVILVCSFIFGGQP